MTNVIGDIAGQYDALIKLIDIMPKSDIISVGDMIDRGPDSKKVLDYFMNNSGRKAILGNHEHMMLDFFTQGRYYNANVWFGNGGRATVDSFDPLAERQFIDAVPKEYIDWINNLPMYIEIDDILIAHAFLSNYEESDEKELEEACKLGKNSFDVKGDGSILWNRGEPWPVEKWKLQVAGHNSQFGLREWRHKNGEVYAICLDDSRHKKLTGLNLETMQIYQVDY